MVIECLPGEFTVCKLLDFSQIDLTRPFHFLAHTDEECSLACPIEDVPASTIEREDHWRGLRIQGTLDFSLIGILAKISTHLADHNISIFVISTYNTDYIYLKSQQLEEAVNVLTQAGYDVRI